MNYQTKPKILLVEDNAIISLAEAETLRSFGYVVETALNGEEALGLFAARADIGLLVADLDLGEGIGGDETARRMLKIREVPVVFLTGHAESQFVERVRGIPRYGYVTKGSGDLQLKSAIENALLLFEERKARKSIGERYQELVENAPVGIFISSSNGQFISVNSAYAHILGFDDPESVVEHFHDLANELYVDPERREEFLSTLREQGRIEEFEFDARRRDGRIIRVSLHARIGEKMEDGSFTIEGFSLDVTEAHRRSEAHRGQRRLLNTVMEHIADVVMIIDSAGVITYVSPNVEAILELPASDFIGRNANDFVHPDDLSTARAAFARAEEAASKHARFRARLVGAEGQLRPVEIAITDREDDPTISGLLVNFHDISEEERLREERLASLNAYAAVLDAMPDPVFVIDVRGDGNFVYVAHNTAGAEETGVPSDRIAGKTPGDLFGPAVGAKFALRYAECARTGKPLKYRETVSDRKGRKILAVVLTPVFREERVVQIIGSTHDVTDQANALEELEEQARMLDLAMHAANMGAWEIDLRSGAAVLDPHLASLFGFSETSFSNVSDFASVVNAEDSAFGRPKIAELAEGRSNRAEMRYRVVSKSGEIRTFMVVGTVGARDEHGVPTKIVGIASDITDHVRNHERVESLLAEKQILLNEVHHRIKNNLAVVGSMLSLKAGTLGEGHPEASAAFQDAQARLKSISLLYEKLFQLRIVGSLSLASYLPPLVDELVALYPHQCRLSVTKEIVDIPLGERPLLNVGIIVSELVTNALKYAYNDRNSGELRVSVSVSGQRLVIAVEDNGVGISRSVAAETAASFGITMVRGLASQHDGTVRITNGNGTRAEVTLRL